MSNKIVNTSEAKEIIINKLKNSKQIYLLDNEDGTLIAIGNDEISALINLYKYL